MTNTAVQLDAVARLVEYLCETRHLPRDDQIMGIYKRWPDVTPEEYLPAVKIYHAREFGERKIAKLRLPEILSRLKNKSAYMTKVTFMGVSWKKENGSWSGKASWSL
jgi:hypothetical protein